MVEQTEKKALKHILWMSKYGIMHFCYVRLAGWHTVLFLEGRKKVQNINVLILHQTHTTKRLCDMNFN